MTNDRSLTGEDRSEESERELDSAELADQRRQFEKFSPPYVTPDGIILTEARLDEIFAEAETQAEYVAALLAEVVPRWDDVVSLNGYVHCGEKLNLALMEHAIKWDREHDVTTLHGGLWMNCGFSASHEPDIRDWEVRLPSITYTS